MKQIALKSFMQNNPFKHLEYMGIGCLIFFYSEFLTKLSLLKGSFFYFPMRSLNNNLIFYTNSIVFIPN